VSRQIFLIPIFELIGTSTSGASKNVVEALEKVRQSLPFLSDLRTDISDLSQVDYLFLAFFKTVARIRETYITWGQILCGYIENQMFPASSSAHPIQSNLLRASHRQS
jgi:hypothetical protein